MRDEFHSAEKRPLSEIDGEIVKVKAEIDEKYYQLGKTVCEIADKDAEKIGELVDRLVELKEERKALNTERKSKNESE